MFSIAHLCAMSSTVAYCSPRGWMGGVVTRSPILLNIFLDLFGSFGSANGAGGLHLHVCIPVCVPHSPFSQPRACENGCAPRFVLHSCLARGHQSVWRQGGGLSALMPALRCSGLQRWAWDHPYRTCKWKQSRSLPPSCHLRRYVLDHHENTERCLSDNV